MATFFNLSKRPSFDTANENLENGRHLPDTRHTARRKKAGNPHTCQTSNRSTQANEQGRCKIIIIFAILITVNSRLINIENADLSCKTFCCCCQNGIWQPSGSLLTGSLQPKISKIPRHCALEPSGLTCGFCTMKPPPPPPPPSTLLPC